MNLIVDQAGSGPQLTFVHGWAMHGGLFDPLTRVLEDYRLQRVDLPGHGRNRDLPWPTDTAELIAELIEAAAGGWLVGWSLGGLLAMQAALADPSRIRGLVLIAATPCFSQQPHWPHGVAESLVAQLADELASAPQQVLNRFLALEVHGSVNAAADLKLLRAEAFRHGLPQPEALAAGLDHLCSTDLTDQLDQLAVPVVLIGGRRDRLVSFDALDASASRMLNATVVAIPGAAHAPFLTNPEAVAEAIGQATGQLRS